NGHHVQPGIAPLIEGERREAQQNQSEGQLCRVVSLVVLAELVPSEEVAPSGKQTDQCEPKGQDYRRGAQISQHERSLHYSCHSERSRSRRRGAVEESLAIPRSPRSTRYV